MWPIQLAFRILISCRIFLCSLTVSNTSSFLTWSFKLIFSSLLQHHISKLSRYFWSAARSVQVMEWIKRNRCLIPNRGRRLLCKTSSPVLGPVHCIFQWLSVDLSLGGKGASAWRWPLHLYTFVAGIGTFSLFIFYIFSTTIHNIVGWVPGNRQKELRSGKPIL